MVEVGAGLFLDPFAPEIDDALAALRRGPAGQLLAHHQRQRFLDRRVGAIPDVGQIGLGELVLQHVADIVADPGHPESTDRLDAGLLDRIVDGARLLALGRELRVDPEIVAGALQRHGIAEAARHRYVDAGRLLRQFGEPGAVAGKRRLVLGETDLELVIAGDRAHADRHGTLEDVGVRAVLRLVARVVAGTGH